MQEKTINNNMEEMEDKNQYFLYSKITDRVKPVKILYLHGLESKLSNAKRKILEEYGTVTAPDLDYKNNPRMIETLLRDFQNQKFDVVMGSSMGGFAGFYLAKALMVPALLFNPALPYRSVEQEIPSDLPEFHSKPVQMIIGVKDPLIKASDTLQFISEKLPQKNMWSIHLRHELEHRIPLEIFEEEVRLYFKKI